MQELRLTQLIVFSGLALAILTAIMWLMPPNQSLDDNNAALCDDRD